MEILSRKRCIIGEGPIWNAKERVAYIMNGLENEICKIDISSGELSVIHTQKLVAAIGFDKENRMIASCLDGVYYIVGDEMIPLYDTKKYSISGGNDMKVGPDGRIYIGTQCEKRRGLSDKVDGKLYSIDKDGNVRTLLNGLILSNGMEWSPDEKRFFHTDSDTGIIREYFFDKESGDIAFSGREAAVPGVDGFTIGEDGCLYVGCWGARAPRRGRYRDAHCEILYRSPSKNSNELWLYGRGYGSSRRHHRRLWKRP